MAREWVEYHSARAGRSCVLFGGRRCSKGGKAGGRTGDFGKTVFALKTDDRNFSGGVGLRFQRNLTLSLAYIRRRRAIAINHFSPKTYRIAVNQCGPRLYSPVGSRMSSLAWTNHYRVVVCGNPTITPFNLYTVWSIAFGIFWTGISYLRRLS